MKFAFKQLPTLNIFHTFSWCFYCWFEQVNVRRLPPLVLETDANMSVTDWKLDVRIFEHGWKFDWPPPSTCLLSYQLPVPVNENTDQKR